MTDIRPRMVDGVGWGHDDCPQLAKSSFEQYQPSECKITGKKCFYRVCPVWAQRMAAWAWEAKSLMNLSRIAIEQYGDKTGMLAANLRTLVEDYPGKPTSRQVKDGE